MKLCLDYKSKELLNDVSSLFGVKADIIKEVWEFTLFTWLLKCVDNENKVVSCPIPYFGSVGIKYKGDTFDDKNKLTSDLDCFISVSDDFKKTLHTVINGDFSEVSDYVREKYIHKLVESRVNEENN